MRQLCPDDERLMDYIEDRLSEEDRSVVEEHLSDCEKCLEELVVTNSLLGDRDRFELEPAPAEVTEATVHLVIGQRPLPYRFLIDKVKQFVESLASLMGNTFQIRPWGRLNLTQIRGSKTVACEDYVCLEVPFKETKTEIEIEKTGINKAHIRVKLHKPCNHRKAMRVTLKKGEREVASYLLDAAQVLFEDIPFGHYSISLAEDSMKLGTYSFEIKESHHGGK